MNTVRMRPGTRPRTEYDHGNDIMAKQMYSEKSRAAVYGALRQPIRTIRIEAQTNLLPAACPVFDRILRLQLKLLANTGAIFSLDGRNPAVPAGLAFNVIFLLELGLLVFSHDGFFAIESRVGRRLGIQRHFSRRMRSFCRSRASDERD